MGIATLLSGNTRRAPDERKFMNSKKEGLYLIDDKDLEIVVVHRTTGKSEEWSQVVKELSSSRSVIRPNYIDRVAGRNFGRIAGYTATCKRQRPRRVVEGDMWRVFLGEFW
jgi:hypothetical protein